MQELNGQVAVITGGASGIGLALAYRFAEAGMAVAVGDVEELALDVAVEELRGSGANVYGARLDVSDVEIAVEFSVDSVPPPKLELVRFLDGGNGLDVLFDSPTNMVDGEWDVDCATLFDNAQQIGAAGTCAWTNSSALRVTFGAGAQIVPFDSAAP